MELTDNELIVNANNGDVMALEELIYRYDKMVLRLAMKYTGNSDDAKDIYQEVFLRVYKNLSGFQFKSEFSTWLFRIATNLCISFKRKHSRSNQLSLDEENNSDYVSSLAGSDEFLPDSITENKEFGNKVNEALNTLSPNQRMSFLLKHYEGYKIREIAEMMNCKEGTIKKYLFESVRKLRLQLENSY